MKLSRIILASTLIIGVAVIAGCSTSSTTPTSPSSTSQTTPTNQTTSQDISQQGTQKPSAIKMGVTKMLSITKDLKSSIDAGDEVKVKATGPQLEDAWSPFEDNVKQKYPDLYKKVEEFLDPTIAGCKASPLDKQTLGTLNGELTQALNEIAAKE